MLRHDAPMSLQPKPRSHRFQVIRIDARNSRAATETLASLQLLPSDSQQQRPVRILRTPGVELLARHFDFSCICYDHKITGKHVWGPFRAMFPHEVRSDGCCHTAEGLTSSIDVAPIWLDFTLFCKCSLTWHILVSFFALKT